MRFAENRNLRAASCCRREVMNGACAFLRRSFLSTDATTASPARSSVEIASASSFVFGSAFSPFHFQMRDSNGNGFGIRSFACGLHVMSTDQYSSGMNALISSSR